MELIQKLEFLKSDITVITARLPYELCSLHWDLAWAQALTNSPHTVSFTQIKNTGSSGIARGVFFAVMSQANHKDLQSPLLNRFKLISIGFGAGATAF